MHSFGSRSKVKRIVVARRRCRRAEKGKGRMEGRKGGRKGVNGELAVNPSS